MDMPVTEDELRGKWTLQSQKNGEGVNGPGSHRRQSSHRREWTCQSQR
jgi:hypothetical protein